ncbi:MAG: SPOR domain-containing protein [Alphaproteobacteria bacterium]|nr:SPOR domain-containing protein [Alphaproteobacteria bacterium]
MSGDVDEEATAGDREDASAAVSGGAPTPLTGKETQSFSLASASESEQTESVEARHLTRSDVEDEHRGVFRPRDFAEAPGTWLDVAEIPHTRTRASDSASGEAGQLAQSRRFSDSVTTPPSGAAGRVQVAEMSYDEERAQPRPTLALAPPSAPAPAPAPAPSASQDDSAKKAKLGGSEGLPEVDLTQPWTREAVKAPSDPVRPRLVREGEALPDLPSAPLPGIDESATLDSKPSARHEQPAGTGRESAEVSGTVEQESAEAPAPPSLPVSAPTPEAKLRPASFTSSGADDAFQPLNSSPAPEALRALLDTRGTGLTEQAPVSMAAPAPVDRAPRLKAGTYLVVGSFRNAENAERLAQKHHNLDAMVLSVSVDGNPFHRVAVPVADGDIEQTQERVLAAGFSSVWPLQR